MAGGKCCGICKLVGLLVGIGALNWGLIAVANVNLVERLLGDMTMPAKIVYGVIGLAGLIKLVSLVKACPCTGGTCGSGKS